jgi:hypothetical protein
MELGIPEAETGLLKGVERAAAIESLLKTAADFRAIAQTLAVRQGKLLHQLRPDFLDMPSKGKSRRENRKRRPAAGRQKS